MKIIRLQNNDNFHYTIFSYIILYSQISRRIPTTARKFSSSAITQALLWTSSWALIKFRQRCRSFFKRSKRKQSARRSTTYETSRKTLESNTLLLSVCCYLNWCKATRLSLDPIKSNKTKRTSRETPAGRMPNLRRLWKFRVRHAEWKSASQRRSTCRRSNPIGRTLNAERSSSNIIESTRAAENKAFNKRIAALEVKVKILMFIVKNLQQDFAKINHHNIP